MTSRMDLKYKILAIICQLRHYTDGFILFKELLTRCKNETYTYFYSNLDVDIVNFEGK